MKANKVFLFILSIVLLFNITGCGKSSEKEKEEENPVPRELKSIEEDIESILATLSDPSLSEEKREENKTKKKQQTDSKEDEEQMNQKDEETGGKDKEQGEDKEEGKKKEEGKNKEAEKEKENGEGGGQKEESQKEKGDGKSSEGETSDGEKEDPKMKEEEQKKENWKQIEKTLKGIHSTWNSYLPKAVKDGVPPKLTEEFGDMLNEVTNMSLEKNNAQMLLAVNKLYSFIPNALAVYDSHIHPGIKKVRYYTRNVIYNANIGDWEQAAKDAEELESVWSSTKSMVAKKSKEDVETLNYAVKDLLKVVQMESKQLVFIKGEIVMQNIKDIEKTLKDGEESGKI
jgi:hypothetical protein